MTATEADVTALSSPRSTRFGVLFFVIVPFIGLILAICLAWGRGVYAFDIFQLVFWHLVTGIGMTVGFHRLFTHGSFKTVWPIRAVLGILGSMTVEGNLFKWVAVHKQHHSKSDKEGDPHSPTHGHGEGFFAVLRGFWHAHLGWLFSHNMSPEDITRKTKTLRKDRLLVLIDQLFLLWVGLGLLFPAIIGWLFSGTLEGTLRGLLWGGFIRIGTVHHVTWSINSVCHLWGQQDFKTGDGSRNNSFCSLIGLGENWHNGYHAFPTSPKHGILSGQIDPSWWVIKILSGCKLAWDIDKHLPSPEKIKERKQRT